MRDWEMAEHFAERDGVRMASGQHIQAPDSMIDRARRIVAGEFVPENVKTSKRRWAEALLSEHAAREEAERRADENAALIGIHDPQGLDHLEEAMLACEQRDAAVARAEQAERERDTFMEASEANAAAYLEAEARVAGLEAVLREKVVALRKWGYHRLDFSGYYAGEGGCDCGWDDYSVLLFAGGSDEKS